MVVFETDEELEEQENLQAASQRQTTSVRSGVSAYPLVRGLQPISQHAIIREDQSNVSYLSSDALDFESGVYGYPIAFQKDSSYQSNRFYQPPPVPPSSFSSTYNQILEPSIFPGLVSRRTSVTGGGAVGGMAGGERRPLSLFGGMAGYAATTSNVPDLLSSTWSHSVDPDQYQYRSSFASSPAFQKTYQHQNPLINCQPKYDASMIDKGLLANDIFYGNPREGGDIHSSLAFKRATSLENESTPKPCDLANQHRESVGNPFHHRSRHHHFPHQHLHHQQISSPYSLSNVVGQNQTHHLRRSHTLAESSPLSQSPSLHKTLPLLPSDKTTPNVHVIRPKFSETRDLQSLRSPLMSQAAMVLPEVRRPISRGRCNSSPATFSIDATVSIEAQIEQNSLLSVMDIAAMKLSDHTSSYPLPKLLPSYFYLFMDFLTFEPANENSRHVITRFPAGNQGFLAMVSQTITVEQLQSFISPMCYSGLPECVPGSCFYVSVPFDISDLQTGTFKSICIYECQATCADKYPAVVEAQSSVFSFGQKILQTRERRKRHKVSSKLAADVGSTAASIHISSTKGKESAEIDIASPEPAGASGTFQFDFCASFFNSFLDGFQYFETPMEGKLALENLNVVQV